MDPSSLSKPFLHSLSGKITRDQTSHLSSQEGVLGRELGTRSGQLTQTGEPPLVAGTETRTPSVSGGLVSLAWKGSWNPLTCMESIGVRGGRLGFTFSSLGCV